MKLYKITILSISTLVTFFSTLNVFANISTTVISSTNSANINISSASVISSTGKQEIISKLSDTSEIFQLSILEGNMFTTGQYAIISSNDLTVSKIPVYSSPLTYSNILGNLDIGSIVVISGTEEDFFKILYNDNIAYIENKYTKPIDFAKKDNTTTQDNKPKSKYVKITAQDGLNFRDAPSTSSNILQTLPLNSYASLLEVQDSWLKIELENGKIGYVSSLFTSIVDKIETEPPKQNPIIPEDFNGENIVNFAKQYLGKPYVYGSTNLDIGTDCSGFTFSVFQNFGISINRISKDQYLNGVYVEKENLQVADLVFFNTGGTSNISHVGIYIGNNEYIHCTDSKAQGVIISSLNNVYAEKTYFGAKRVID